MKNKKIKVKELKFRSVVMVSKEDFEYYRMIALPHYGIMDSISGHGMILRLIRNSNMSKMDFISGDYGPEDIHSDTFSTFLVLDPNNTGIFDEYKEFRIKAEKNMIIYLGDNVSVTPWKNSKMNKKPLNKSNPHGTWS